MTEGDIYYGKLAEFAMHQCTFYECFKCKKPYFGGMQDCAQALESENSDDLNPESLLCKKCAVKELGYGESFCKKHGNEFIDWKCMRCCNMAVFFCRGGTYTFCTPCHNDAMASRNNITNKCKGGPKCPLGLASHPIASTNKSSCFPMGCSLCRSEKLALIAANEQANAGVNLEERKEMIDRFDHVKGHDIGREMRIHRAAP